MKNSRAHALSDGRRNAAFTLVETLIAATILVVFALGTAATLNVMNRLASNTRTAIAAQITVGSYIAEAMASDYTPTFTPALLAGTVAGSDIDGDGEGDGVVHASNVPLIVMRDSKTAGVQRNVITGTVYRHCATVDSTLAIQRVTFLIRYTLRGRNYHYRVATLKAREK